MIDKLLEKFYAGATSREEEMLLCELLSQNQDSRYDADRSVICPLHRRMPDFEKMARRASGRRLAFEALTPGPVAASVAAMIAALGASLYNRQPDIAPAESDITVAEATEQTRLALMLISDAFERGFQELDNLNDL